MPRNTKKIIIGIIIAIVLILIIIGVILYTLTDIFKPANVTFLKYASQNADVFSAIFNIKEENEYVEKLENSKFESNAVINAKLNIKEQEDLNDIASKFAINVNTKSDMLNEKGYSKVNLSYDNSDIVNLELNNQNNMYGIKFADVVTKYVSIENKELKALAEKVGMDSTQIPDQIAKYSYTDIFSQIDFTTEEKEQLAKKYATIIINNIPEENFVKQTKQMITVDQATITANAYILNTNKQQLEELAAKILEQLSTDEIILSKIDKIDAEIAKSEQLEKTLKEQYTEQISTIIEELNSEENKEADQQTNIKLTVYEANRKLIRTSIDTDYVKTNIDVSKTDSKSSMNIQIEETTESEYKTGALKVTKETEGTTENIIADATLTMNEETTTGQISRIRKQEGNNITTQINVKANQDNNEYEMAYKNDIAISDNIDIEELTDKNNIVLNNQSAENIQKVIQIISEKQTASFSEKMQPILTRIYAETPIENVEGAFQNNESNVTILESDKNAFNANFEGYTGNKVKSASVQTLLSNLKNYSAGVTIDSATGEIIILIQKDLQSPTSLDEANSKIDSSKTYTVNLEYTNEIASKVTIKANN